MRKISHKTRAHTNDISRRVLTMMTQNLMLSSFADNIFWRETFVKFPPGPVFRPER